MTKEIPVKWLTNIIVNITIINISIVFRIERENN